LCYALYMDKLVITKFWGVGCINCKALNPILEEVASMYKGKIDFTDVNTTDNTDAVKKYNITTIPTLLFEKNGKEVGRLLGLRPKSIIIKKIDEVF